MQAVQQQQKLPEGKKLSADKYHLLKLDERKRNMKSKFGLIRVLAVVFALVLSISLVSCVKDEDLDSVKADAGKTQENVNQLQTDVSALKKSLETIATELKKTADDAATKAAFENAKSALEAADAKLAEDIAAANTAITEAKNTYDANIDDLEAADAKLKEDLGKANKAIEDAKKDYQAKIDKIIADLGEVKKSVGNNASDIEKLQKDLSALSTKVGTLPTMENLKDYVKNTDLNTKFADYLKENKYITVADIANFVSETDIDAKIKTLETKVTGQINTINSNLSSLEEKVNGIVGEGDTTLAGTVASLKESVKTLENKKFLDDYIALTKTLQGDGEYSFKNFIAKADVVTKGPYNEKELKSFQAQIETIKFFLARATTMDEVKKAFEDLEAAKAGLRSLTQVVQDYLKEFTVIANNKATKDAFAELTEAYNALVEHEATTAKDLEAVAAYNTVKAAYENFFGTEIVPDEAGTIGAVKAGANVVSFVNANLAGKTVVYGASDANVAKAVADYNAFKEAYFANEEWNAYYGIVNEKGEAEKADVSVVAESLAMGAEIRGYAQRLELLKAAKTKLDAKYEGGKLAFAWNDYNGGTDVRPIASKDETAKNVNEVIAAWIAGGAEGEEWNVLPDGVANEFGTYKDCLNALEDANINAILEAVTGKATFKADLDNALAYIKAMNDLYIEKDVKNAILDAISALVDIENVELSSTVNGKMESLNTLINELFAAVADIDKKYENKTSGNADDMVPVAVVAKVTAYLNQYKELAKEIKTVKDTYYVDGKGSIANLSSEAYAMIATFENNVTKICNDLKAALDTEIVKTVTAPEAATLLTEMKALYAEYTKAAYEAYLKAKDCLDKIENVKLDMGKQLGEAFSYVRDAIKNYKLTFNTPITALDVKEDGTEVTVTVYLIELQDNLTKMWETYDALAQTAMTEAAAINATITGLKDCKAEKMNNYTNITTAKSTMDAWFTRYCSAETEDKTWAKMVAEDLVGIPLYGESTGNYEFIDATLFNTLNTLNAATVKAYNEVYTPALAAWNEKYDIAKVDTTIHAGKKYEEADAAWTELLKNYDVDLSDAYLGLKEEYNTKKAYDAVKETYTANCNGADAAAQKIIEQINALVAAYANLKTYADVTADITNNLNKVDTDLQNFYNTYCDGKCYFWLAEEGEAEAGTNNNGEGAKDYIVELEKVRAMVKFLTETKDCEAAIIESQRKAFVSTLTSVVSNGEKGNHASQLMDIATYTNAYIDAVLNPKTTPGTGE